MNNSLKTVLLLGLLSGILLALGELLGGAQGLVTAFGFAVLMNFVSYWFSDKIVLKMYRAQEVGPDHKLSILTRRDGRLVRVDRATRLAADVTRVTDGATQPVAQDLVTIAASSDDDR